MKISFVEEEVKFGIGNWNSLLKQIIKEAVYSKDVIQCGLCMSVASADTKGREAKTDCYGRLLHRKN